MGTIASVAIAITEAVSAAFQSPNNPDYDTVQVKLPAAWTAADLKLQFSDDEGTTWFNVVESDGSVSKLTSIPTSGGGLVAAPHDANSGLDYWAQAMKAIPNGYFRVVSIDTADESNENQAAARTVDLLVS